MVLTTVMGYDNMVKIKSSNGIVQNALNAKGFSERDVRTMADILKSKPWNTPEYKAKTKAELDRRMHRIYGDKKVDELKRLLKRLGYWKD